MTPCPRCGYAGDIAAGALRKTPIKLRYCVRQTVNLPDGSTIEKISPVRVGYTLEERRNGTMEASMRLIQSKENFLRWLEFEPPTIENILGRTKS